MFFLMPTHIFYSIWFWWNKFSKWLIDMQSDSSSVHKLQLLSKQTIYEHIYMHTHTCTCKVVFFQLSSTKLMGLGIAFCSCTRTLFYIYILYYYIATKKCLFVEYFYMVYTWHNWIICCVLEEFMCSDGFILGMKVGVGWHPPHIPS